MKKVKVRPGFMYEKSQRVKIQVEKMKKKKTLLAKDVEDLMKQKGDMSGKVK